MSIATTTRKAGPFTGNGVTTVFPFSFKVFAAADLTVTSATGGVETTLVLNSNYSVTLNSNQDTSPGGNVTLFVAPTSFYTVTITSAVAQTQPVVLTNNGGFYPTVINNALDRLTILIQQLAEGLSRSLKITLSSSTAISTTLPTPVANKAIGWNSTATGFANLDVTGGGGGGGEVSSVNGQIGAVTITAAGLGAVTSVNGQTGPAVTLVTGVSSVNGSTGAVTVTPASISAVATAARGTANGVASLDSSGLVPSSQLPTTGSYKGTWNATTNTPTIVSGVGVNGDFYKVATAGSTTIDGVSSWAIGDEIRFGASTWQKIANSAAVSSVAGRTGAVVLGTTDIAGVATARILGRTTAGTGAAEELTGTQLTAMLDAFASASKGLVPSPVTATGKVLMDDGTWKDPGVKYASSYGVSASNTASQNVTGFAAVAAAGPGRYILPAGTLQVNATLPMGTGQVWEGAGSGVTTIQWTAVPASGGIEAGTKTSIGLKGMTLDSNGVANLLGVINWNTILDFYIDDIKLINVNKYGIAINNSNTGLVSNFEIIHSVKALTQNQAIVVSSSTTQSQNIIFRDGTCRNSAINWCGADIWFERVSIYGWSFGGGFTSEQNANTTRGGLLHCLATDGTGVDVNATRCPGAEVWGDTVSVIGFQSIANDGMGIDFGSKNGILSSSQFVNNGRGTSGFSGISMRYGTATYNASGALVVGCRSVDTGPGTQAYGYTEQSASLANITVRACSFIGNVTGPTNILSSTTVTDASGGGVSLATTAPAAVGTTAVVGVGTTAARADHVHVHGAQTDGTLHAAATTSVAGFMSAADKTKLDSTATLSSATPASVGAQTPGVATTASRSDHIHDHGNQTAGSHHAAATTSVAGFMSTTDKTKLDGLSSANATTSTAGYMSAADKTKLDAVSNGAILTASQAFGGATIANGTIGAQGATLAGVAFGDYIDVGFSFPLQNCTAMAFVTAANGVQCIFTNNTGASVTLAAGTIYFRAMKR